MAENLIERKALSLQWLVQSKSSLRSARTAFPSTQSASRTRLAPEVDFQPNINALESRKADLSQTTDVCNARLRFKKGDLSRRTIRPFLREESAECVPFQEEVGLDVLVHGQFQHNDTVE